MLIDCSVSPCFISCNLLYDVIIVAETSRSVSVLQPMYSAVILDSVSCCSEVVVVNKLNQ